MTLTCARRLLSVLLLLLVVFGSDALTASADAAGFHLERGSRGAAVRTLEVRLVKVAALPRAAVDRRYRAATVRAVKRFQRARRLRVWLATEHVRMRTTAQAAADDHPHERPPRRTGEIAVTALARKLFAAGIATRVVAALMPGDRSIMHLDTVFTLCDRDLATLYPPGRSSANLFPSPRLRNRCAPPCPPNYPGSRCPSPAVAGSYGLSTTHSPTVWTFPGRWC